MKLKFVLLILTIFTFVESTTSRTYLQTIAQHTTTVNSNFIGRKSARKVKVVWTVTKEGVTKTYHTSKNKPVQINLSEFNGDNTGKYEIVAVEYKTGNIISKEVVYSMEDCTWAEGLYYTWSSFRHYEDYKYMLYKGFKISVSPKYFEEMSFRGYKLDLILAETLNTMEESVDNEVLEGFLKKYVDISLATKSEISPLGCDSRGVAACATNRAYYYKKAAYEDSKTLYSVHFRDPSYLDMDFIMLHELAHIVHFELIRNNSSLVRRIEQNYDRYVDLYVGEYASTSEFEMFAEVSWKVLMGKDSEERRRNPEMVKIVEEAWSIEPVR